MGSGRVALFVPSLRGGGAERVMVNLAREFSGSGLDVDLVVVKAEGPYLAEVPAAVRLVDLGARGVAGALLPLAGYLRRERPCALLATPRHASVVALVAQRFSGASTRVVVREANTPSQSLGRTSSVKDRLSLLLAGRLYAWADAVIAVSRGVADDLMCKMGVWADRIKVIYNPVVTPDLVEKAAAAPAHRWFEPGEPPVILGVGRLAEQKDFPTLVRAFALVRQRCEARLVILGEGPLRGELEELVRTLGLEQAVDLPGFVENPFSYMKRAALFVLSSRWEGLPNVLIQALALGTPVVATDCPSGPAEILAGGQYGPLVPVGDVEALAGAIETALRGPGRGPAPPEAVREYRAEVVAQLYREALVGGG